MTEQYNNLQNTLLETNIKIQELQQQNFKLQQKHNALTRKQFYYKFKKKGPAFYIIVSGLEYKDDMTRVKIGICGCPKRNIQNCPHCNEVLEDNKDHDSIDKRLKNHRTLWPKLVVKFIVYTPDAQLLEKCMKRVYRKRINPNGHEIIEGIPVHDIIEKTQEYLDMFNVFNRNQEYLLEENAEKYNIKTKTIMKDVSEYPEEYPRLVIENDTDTDTNDPQDSEETEEEMEEVAERVYDRKFDTMLADLEKYTDKKLKDLLREHNLRQAGLKADKKIRMKNYILEQMKLPTVPLPGKTKICEECVTKKVLNDNNFRKLGGVDLSWYNKVCIDCETTKCKTEQLYRVPIHTEIKPNSLTKTCSGCKTVKSYDDFHKNKSNRDGLVSRCKNCESDRKSGTIRVRLEKKKPDNVPCGYKWCPKCEITKSGDAFRKASKRQDGLQSMCRNCDNEAKKRNRLKNKLAKK